MYNKYINTLVTLLYGIKSIIGIDTIQNQISRIEITIYLSWWIMDYSKQIVRISKNISYVFNNKPDHVEEKLQRFQPNTKSLIIEENIIWNYT